IGPDPRNFNQRVSLGRNDLLIRTFLKLNDSDVELISMLWSLIGGGFHLHMNNKRKRKHLQSE
ncbi:hypothetical protein PO638_24135, partial [Escherichia coli]